MRTHVTTLTAKSILHRSTKVLVAALASVLSVLVLNAASAQSASEKKDSLAAAIAAVCARRTINGLSIQNAVPGSWLLEDTVSTSDGAPLRQDIRLALPEGSELTLEIRFAGGAPRQVRASYFTLTDQQLVPDLLAIADGGCTIRSARSIRRGQTPWVYLDQLDGDMETLRWTEILQAPWPPGVVTQGVPVALVDSGLAYDLPLFRDRLARDAEGEPIGYDFWDMDPWPYDGDTSRGAFLPVRHGTAVASILAREAPNAVLAPMRYPRPDMNRMADIVAQSIEHGVKILAMPLGSNAPDDWTAFADAIKDQDILAIVSAGNNGRDIDREPVYPASLTLENILTVTSADGFGRLAPGSNWGQESVDLMVPAENIAVTDFRGAAGVTSGSSYAVPRVAALAARILENQPHLSARELKTQILARAAPSPFEKERLVAAGWIPDPDKD
ncbi:hypothetical protein GCM10009077_25720 [Roseibium denhamense]|uniref:Subtilase family protein n=1 Tax=Roseibium denhamense TaxID=76305 RepID=A0ABY1PKC6_9HYPH|nr:Subtilase family protein [Roseibium denhamense]